MSISTKIMIIHTISNEACPVFFSLSFAPFPRLHRVNRHHQHHHRRRLHPFFSPDFIRMRFKKSVRCAKNLVERSYLVNLLNCVTSLVWIYLFDSEIIRARQCHYNVNNVFRVKWFSFKINHHWAIAMPFLFFFCSPQYRLVSSGQHNEYIKQFI